MIHLVFDQEQDSNNRTDFVAICKSDFTKLVKKFNIQNLIVETIQLVKISAWFLCHFKRGTNMALNTVFIWEFDVEKFP